jgi:hypothetical protein
MQRRLLRTISVTITITERWSVVYGESEGARPGRVQMGARTLRRQSVSMTADVTAQPCRISPMEPRPEAPE